MHGRWNRAILALGLAALGAPPPAGGAPDEDPAGAAAAEIRRHFSSPDYEKLRRTDEQFLRDLYAAVLGREPDAKGLEGWLAAIRDGLPRAKAVERFLESTEARARRAPPPKDTARLAGNVLFDRTGLFINSASAFPPEAYADLVRLANVAWITLQIDNTGKPREDNVEDLRKGWADHWRAKGVKVGFWGVPRGPGYNARKLSAAEAEAARAKIAPLVAGDARLAVRLTSEHKGDFYIADLEGPFQDNEGDPALNRVYVEAFGAAADPKLPRALSSMGRVALDMRPWIEAGWDAMPQAYWNSYAHYRPGLCMDFYVRERDWPAGRVHPTIATYRGEGEDREVTLEQYAEDLRTAGVKGFSYYLPESYLHTDEGRWRQLGAMGR